jgi:endoglucanase
MRWQPVALAVGAVTVLGGVAAAATMLPNDHPRDVGGVVSGSSPTPLVSPGVPAAPAPPPNPLAGKQFYVDPNSKARQAGVRPIGTQPQAFWYGDWVPSSSLTDEVRTVVRRASSAGRVPVFVTYDVPVRDCHGYSGGGASSPAAYRQWINAFATGIGSQSAVVIVEPDALAQLDCLSAGDKETRLSLLRSAVERLAAGNETAVYLDAGHSGWIAPDEMATRLRSAGITKARGFSLNVSNFGRTDNETAYGHAVESALGARTPFVIDTSRNGLGPAPDSAWCNPPGRALGATPTSRTGQIDVDALLWIKRPGESDGTCNGGPPAGQFWTDYAKGLVERSS